MGQRSKSVRDPVHGYIEVEPALLPLVDSPLLQRLRLVRQLGFAYLVYPGANHTRFEHSLGTYYVAGLMCEALELSPEDRAQALAAALLHDLGHLLNDQGETPSLRGIGEIGKVDPEAILALADPTDPIFERDRERLAQVRASRQSAAQNYFRSN